MFWVVCAGEIANAETRFHGGFAEIIGNIVMELLGSSDEM